MSSLYDFTVEGISGEQVALAQFKGKVSLVVNTASRCGFTSQYAGLQELYDKYRERGFVVLAFPSNNFGAQEPGSNAEIQQFCELKFKTTFPIFGKINVKGDKRHPLYSFLTTESAEDYHGDPGWNFVKFLIDKEGQVVGRFSSMTGPSSKKIARAIESLL